jgi:hypothetical protein
MSTAPARFQIDQVREDFPRREMFLAWADTLDALRADAQAAQGNDVARSPRVTRHLAAVLTRKAKTSVPVPITDRAK